MALYMDIHRHVEGLTGEAAAGAPARDLAVQEKYGVRYLRYWYEATGTVSCLCEPPSKDAAVAVHREAHGLMADEIIEVKEGAWAEEASPQEGRSMNAVQFFLEQYNPVRTTVDDLVFAGLSDEQLRQAPGPDQNSLAWLLWHASRWEDFVLSLLDTDHRQVLDQEDWLERLNLSRRDGGTGMTAQEFSDFNADVNITGVRADCAAVGQRTRRGAPALRPVEVDELAEQSIRAQCFPNGII